MLPVCNCCNIKPLNTNNSWTWCPIFKNSSANESSILTNSPEPITVRFAGHFLFPLKLIQSRPQYYIWNAQVWVICYVANTAHLPTKATSNNYEKRKTWIWMDARERKRLWPAWLFAIYFVLTSFFSACSFLFFSLFFSLSLYS